MFLVSAVFSTYCLITFISLSVCLGNTHHEILNLPNYTSCFVFKRMLSISVRVNAFTLSGFYEALYSRITYFYVFLNDCYQSCETSFHEASPINNELIKTCCSLVLLFFSQTYKATKNQFFSFNEKSIS